MSFKYIMNKSGPKTDQHNNRVKNFTLILLFLIKFINFRFIDLISKWPGSVHDAFIFNNSGLAHFLEGGDNGWLLGDSGYPQRRYLMTPVTQPADQAEERYNLKHAKTQGCCGEEF